MVVTVIVSRRVWREMTVDDATVMVTGLVCRIRMQMQERRGRRRHLEADTHEPHETEAFHLCRIVAHILKPVKDVRRGNLEGSHKS